MSSSDVIHAPWTDEQVKALADFQSRDGWPHFGCGGSPHTHGRSPLLTPTRAGWTCPDPDCDYTSDWAWAYMADTAASETSDRPRPVVEAETAGCTVWHLTRHSIARVADAIDRLRPWVFTKSYWRPTGPDHRNDVVGLRIGEYPNHIVAFFDDWIIRHPDGTFSTHKAPATDTAKQKTKASR